MPGPSPREELTTAVEGLLAEEFQGLVGDAQVSGQKLSELAEDLTRYWTLSQSGSDVAEAELRHVQAQIALILARQDVAARKRLERVLLGLVTVGAKLAKAVLLA